ncbi:hypothetical protein ACTXT7_011577 [Hymenolepis weldensis]
MGVEIITYSLLGLERYLAFQPSWSYEVSNDQTSDTGSPGRALRLRNSDPVGSARVFLSTSIRIQLATSTFTTFCSNSVEVGTYAIRDGNRLCDKEYRHFCAFGQSVLSLNVPLCEVGDYTSNVHWCTPIERNGRPHLFLKKVAEFGVSP